MGQEYLLDTNCVIDILGNVMPEKGKKFVSNLKPIVSVVSYIETLGWYRVTPKKLIPLQNFMNFASILPLDQTIIEKTIEIRQQKKIKLGDSIIAATALIHNLTLFTRNTADFKNIEGLKVINPYEL